MWYHIGVNGEFKLNCKCGAGRGDRIWARSIKLTYTYAIIWLVGAKIKGAYLL